MNRIVICGNIIVDSVKVIAEWPRTGMLVPISSVRKAVGGAVCNVGIDLKRLDPTLDVQACGMVGDDGDGAFALGTMKSAGIDCRRVAVRAGVATSFTDVMTLAATGERTFFNLHGADSALVPEDIDVPGLGCDIFHLGYLLLLDGMDAPDDDYGTKAARLLAAVQSAGIRTSIIGSCIHLSLSKNPSRAVQSAGIRTSVDVVSEQSDRFARVMRPALRYCDYLIVNEVEASAATGVSVDDMRGLCEGLMDMGVRRKVVVHCPDCGAALDDEGRYVEVPSLDLPPGWIKGTVGAGDAFCAGMLHSFLKDLSMDEGLRLASCEAAANLSVADATSGARSYEETMVLEKMFQRKEVKRV